MITDNTLASEGKRWQVDSIISLSACTQRRIEVVSRRLKQPLNMLFIASDLSLHGRSHIPAVSFLARNDNRKPRRETQKKGGNDLKRLEVETKYHWPTSLSSVSFESPVLWIKPRKVCFESSKAYSCYLPSMHIAISRFQMKQEAQVWLRMLQFHTILWQSGCEGGTPAHLFRENAFVSAARLS
jgi:hypothetical protein